jgi:hypothetical protein
MPLQSHDGGGDRTGRVDRPYKHIILGIDGTWQAAYRDLFQSNVFRLGVALNCIDQTGDNPQVFIYSSGLGTANASGRLPALFGQGLNESVLEAYINLVSNYAPGDKIYIFGFSRGAVAARALSGFITHSGLLKAEHSSLIEHAWRYFIDEKPLINYPNLRASATYSGVKVEFLGVWDTVSGPYKKQKIMQEYRFTSFKLDPCVKHGVHIISIDDSRAGFDPLVWSGRSHNEQILEQIWMPGVHTDVGGGYQRAFLSTVSLLTMIDKLAEYQPSLSFEESYIDLTLLPILKDEDIIINNERAYRYLGWLGHRRRVENPDPCCHVMHPLTDYLHRKKIRVRTDMMAYEPFFRLVGKNNKLALAKFAVESWYVRKLEKMIKTKLLVP